MPAKHDRQLVEAAAPVAGWYEPAPQLKQELSEAPTLGEYRPTGQLTQAVAPAAVWYFPGLQGGQATLEPVAAEELPTAQRTQVLDATLLNVTEYDPAGQLTQADDPLVAA